MLVNVSLLSLLLSIAFSHKELTQQVLLPPGVSSHQITSLSSNSKALSLDSTSDNLGGPELFVGLTKIPSLTASQQFSFSLSPVLSPHLLTSAKSTPQ